MDELGNLTNTRVSRIDTKLTDILDNNTLTAYDSDNWRSSTWDEKVRKVRATSDLAEHSDKMEIEDFQVVLQTRVREDILTIQEKFNNLVQAVNATLEGLQNFTEQSIAEHCC